MNHSLHQIPHPADLIKRIEPLLSSEGWLLIEDTCMMHFPTAFGQAQQERNKIFESYMSSKGLDTKIGSHVEELLKKMRVFSEIVVRQVELPLNPLPDGRYMHFRFEPLPHLS